jgi:hypothetical protein
MRVALFHMGKWPQVVYECHSFTCSSLLGCAPKVLFVSNQRTMILIFQAVQIMIELSERSVTAVSDP